SVVVLEVRIGLLARAWPEREVRERELARPSRAARGLPGLIDRARHLGERLRRAAAHDPAVSEAGDTAERRLAVAADDQLRPALARRRRPDRARVASLLPAPDPLQLLELLVQPTAPPRRREAAPLQIIVAAAEPHCQHQPTIGKPVERGRLLGE